MKCKQHTKNRFLRYVNFRPAITLFYCCQQNRLVGMLVIGNCCMHCQLPLSLASVSAPCNGLPFLRVMFMLWIEPSALYVFVLLMCFALLSCKSFLCTQGNVFRMFSENFTWQKNNFFTCAMWTVCSENQLLSCFTVWTAFFSKIHICIDFMYVYHCLPLCGLLIYPLLFILLQTTNNSLLNKCNLMQCRLWSRPGK